MGILRFILAFSVLISHSDHSLGIPALHSTVAVRSFYIISGFYMALVLNTKYNDKPYYVFIRSRYLRLFPAYFATLSLTLLYGLIVYSVRGTMEWPLQGWSRTITELDLWTLSVLALTNVFIIGQDLLSLFHQNLTGGLELGLSGLATNESFGGYMLIPQAWTLGIELTFYIIAPFLTRQRVAVVLAVMLASLFCKFIMFPPIGLHPEAMGYRFFPFELVFFCLGILAYHAYRSMLRRNISKTHAILILFLLLGTYSLPQSDSGGWIRYPALAAAIPLLFFLTRNNKADRWIGELSYPIYILHILTFYMITQFTSWTTEGAGAIITVALSILMYQFVDKPLDRWRDKLPVVSSRAFPSPSALMVCILAVSASILLPLAVRNLAIQRHEDRSLPLANYDLLHGHPPQMVAVGLEPVETGGGGRWRWGSTSTTELIFALPKPSNFTFTMEYAPLLGHQEVTVVFNEVVLETITSRDLGRVYRQYTLPGRKENNVIRFFYKDWNGKESPHIPGDTRPLAASFTRLSMAFAP